jgi:hypothetical protein
MTTNSVIAKPDRECKYCAITRASSTISDSCAETESFSVPPLDLSQIDEFRMDADDESSGYFWDEIRQICRNCFDKIFKPSSSRSIVSGGPFICRCEMQRSRLG